MHHTNPKPPRTRGNHEPASGNGGGPEKLMRKIMTMLLMAALLAAACSDSGPTGPSPVPTPEPMTPPTTTPPGGTNAVPQVAGTYRGSGTGEHVPPGGGGIGPGPIGNDACTDVEQDGTSVTIRNTNRSVETARNDNPRGDSRKRRVPAR